MSNRENLTNKLTCTVRILKETLASIIPYVQQNENSTKDSTDSVTVHNKE